MTQVGGATSTDVYLFSCTVLGESRQVLALREFLCLDYAKNSSFINMFFLQMDIPEPGHRLLTGHPDAPRAQDWGCRSPLEVRGLSLGPGPA